MAEHSKWGALSGAWMLVLTAGVLHACSAPAPVPSATPDAPTEATIPAPQVEILPPPSEPPKTEGEVAKPATTPPPADVSAMQQEAPKAAEAVPPAAETEPAPPPKKQYFLENGMTYEAVQKMYGSPGQLTTGTSTSDGVVRWQLEGYGNVQVRFRGGKVDRFTTYAPASQPGPDATPEHQMTRAQYDQISPGMSLYDVSEFLDIEAKLMSTGTAGEKIYRWTDDSGASFGARFENDKLMRKTAFAEAPPRKPAPEEQASEGTVEAEVSEEPIPEDEAVEGEGEGSTEEPYTEEPAPAEKTVYTSRQPAPEEESASGDNRVHRAQGRVRVAGKPAARENAQVEQEETPRERRQRARLPEFRHSLRRGVYEVRVVNETGGRISIGLRQGKLGKDLSLGANGSGSFQVDRGAYDIFYLSADEPYALGKGGSLNIDGQVQADTEIVVGPEGCSVRQLESPIFY